MPKHLLDDFPKLAPEITAITVHGAGRGGGEKVSQYVREIYEAQSQPLEVYATGSGSLLKCSLQRFLANTRKRQHLLAMAGPRDIPLLLACVVRRCSFSVYLQVPYMRATTWRQPLHAALTVFYFLIIYLFAKNIYAVSRNALPWAWRRAQIVLPLTAMADCPQALRDTPLARANDAPLYLVTACRLFPEHGLGSRDIAALEQLLQECARHNQAHSRQFHVLHYGDVEECIRQSLTVYSQVLTHKGYDADWVRASAAPCFFFSRYEGFGLAAYEAAQHGRLVFVNQGFPQELIETSPNIIPLHTGKAYGEILPRMLAHDIGF